MRARRLDQLEGAAAPRAVVVAWLAGAHAFATLSLHAQWLLGQPPDSWPFVLLPRQAAAHVRRTMREARELDVIRAIGDAVDETVFLVELMLHLNAITDDLWRAAALRCRLLVAEMRALALEPDPSGTDGPQPVEGDPSVAERIEMWFSAVSALAAAVATADEARRLLEHRYFDGAPILFPGTADRWEAVREASTEIASVAAGVVGPLDGLRNRGARDAAALLQAGHFADTARAAALGLRGDSRGARAVTARILRTANRAPT